MTPAQKPPLFHPRPQSAPKWGEPATGRVSVSREGSPYAGKGLRKWRKGLRQRRMGLRQRRKGLRKRRKGLRKRRRGLRKLGEGLGQDPVRQEVVGSTVRVLDRAGLIPQDSALLETLGVLVQPVGFKPIVGRRSRPGQVRFLCVSAPSLCSALRALQPLESGKKKTGDRRGVARRPPVRWDQPNRPVRRGSVGGEPCRDATTGVVGRGAGGLRPPTRLQTGDFGRSHTKVAQKNRAGGPGGVALGAGGAS